MTDAIREMTEPLWAAYQADEPLDDVELARVEAFVEAMHRGAMTMGERMLIVADYLDAELVFIRSARHELREELAA